jgi:hypothetical protein
MRKRFIICLNSSTEEQDKLLREFIAENKFGWWHWLNNVWLLFSWDSMLSAVDIRNKIDAIYPEVRNLVLELNAEFDTWAGFGPSSPEQNMFKWLKENWHP